VPRGPRSHSDPPHPAYARSVRLRLCGLSIPAPRLFERILLPLANGLLILSPDPNVVPLGGATNVDTTTQMRLAGAVVGENSPLVHVIHCNGRYYLSNGYHRAYGLSKAGATHMPCIVIHTDDYGRVGAVGGGGTFDRALLESPSPPTIAYFKYDRAYPVSLRTRTRFIQVTWSTYVMPDRG